MKINTYERRGLCYAQVIRDTGGVLAEANGETPTEALHRLRDAVQCQLEAWEKAEELVRDE